MLADRKRVECSVCCVNTPSPPTRKITQRPGASNHGALSTPLVSALDLMDSSQHLYTYTEIKCISSLLPNQNC